MSDQHEKLRALSAEMHALVADTKRAIETTRTLLRGVSGEGYSRVMEQITLGEKRILLVSKWADELDAILSEPAALPVGGQWVSCSPALISAGVDCGKTPRRPSHLNHEHFIAHAAPLAASPSYSPSEMAASFRAGMRTGTVENRTFHNEVELADYLDSLCELEDGAFTGRKWEPAQRALTALQSPPASTPATDTLAQSEVLDACTFKLVSADGETSEPLKIGMYASRKEGGFSVMLERETPLAAEGEARTRVLEMFLARIFAAQRSIAGEYKGWKISGSGSLNEVVAEAREYLNCPMDATPPKPEQPASFIDTTMREVRRTAGMIEQPAQRGDGFAAYVDEAGTIEAQQGDRVAMVKPSVPAEDGADKLPGKLRCLAVLLHQLNAQTACAAVNEALDRLASTGQAPDALLRRVAAAQIAGERFSDDRTEAMWQLRAMLAAADQPGQQS